MKHPPPSELSSALMTSDKMIVQVKTELFWFAKMAMVMTNGVMNAQKQASLISKFWTSRWRNQRRRLPS